MELVTGPEHTVDGICRDGRLVLGHAKTREAMRAGLAMWFETVDRPDLVDAADRLARELGLDWLVNVQFMGEHAARDQPAHLDDRLPGGPQPAVPRRPPCGRRDLGRRAGRAGPARRARRGARFATTTRSSGTTRSRGVDAAAARHCGRLLSLGRQSLIYGLGPVVARFASLLLLPLYTHYLTPADYGQVETLTALVAVAVTIAQLGLVNALFRFALERRGEARAAVIRTALATCAVSGLVVVDDRGAPDADRGAAPARPGNGVAVAAARASGLWISLVYEPTVGLYRVEQRPARYLAITVVNVAVTIALSATLVISLSDKAFGLVAGSYAGTAVALAVVAVDRRHVLYGYLDRAVLGPMLRFGLPFVPSRLALWGLNLSNRLFLLAFATQAAVGVLALGVRIGTSVALVVTAFQLAWPPFAYSIEDDEEARRVYRAVLTWWCVLASWLVLGLALLRYPLLSLLGEQWKPAANPMALVRGRLRLLRGLLRRRRRDRPGQADGAELDRHGHRCDRERGAVHRPDPAVRSHGGGRRDRDLLPARRRVDDHPQRARLPRRLRGQAHRLGRGRRRDRLPRRRPAARLGSRRDRAARDRPRLPAPAGRHGLADAGRATPHPRSRPHVWHRGTERGARRRRLRVAELPRPRPGTRAARPRRSGGGRASAPSCGRPRTARTAAPRIPARACCGTREDPPGGARARRTSRARPGRAAGRASARSADPRRAPCRARPSATRCRRGAARRSPRPGRSRTRGRPWRSSAAARPLRRRAHVVWRSRGHPR